MRKKINPFLKSNNDTGFGVNASAQAGRFINKDGSFNVVKEGISPFDGVSIYHKLLTMPGWEFILIILTCFLAINTVFTCIYLLMPDSEITGVISNNFFEHFAELFFFSAQTFTTVGYGRINPVGVAGGFVASLEALMGLLNFSIVTGLLYGRFSRPKAYLRFSKHALISPYQDGKALMFRFVSYKHDHNLSNVEVIVTLGLTIQENGNDVFKFYSLPLERSRVDNLVMNWTVVHPINDQSPIYGFTPEDLKTADAEVYIMVRGFDEIFSNTVLQRTSYTYNEIIYDAKFDKMYEESEDLSTTIIHLSKLDSYKNLS